MQTAYIGLGSNLGNTTDNLFQARTYLKNLSGIRPNSITASNVYFTEPQGLKDQPWFANQVLSIGCEKGLTAFELLENLLLIENLMGRKREKPWGPRIIDLDILLFKAEVINTRELTVPHPEMCKRAFVLIPLLELNPDLSLPDKTLLRDHLKELVFEIQGDKIWQS